MEIPAIGLEARARLGIRVGKCERTDQTSSDRRRLSERARQLRMETKWQHSEGVVALNQIIPKNVLHRRFWLVGSALPLLANGNLIHLAPCRQLIS